MHERAWRDPGPFAVSLSAYGESMYSTRPAKFGEALTPREQEIIRLVCDGHSNKVIGALLHISAHTVKFHVFRIGVKLGGNRTAMAVKWTRMQCDKAA